MVDVLGSTCDVAAVKKLVDEASATVLINHVEPKDDMIAERQRASFDSTALAVHLNGGTAKLQRKCVSFATAPPPDTPCVIPVTPSNPAQHMCIAEQGGSAEVRSQPALGGQEQEVFPVAHGGVCQRSRRSAGHLVSGICSRALPMPARADCKDACSCHRLRCDVLGDLATPVVSSHVACRRAGEAQLCRPVHIVVWRPLCGSAI